MNELGQMWRHIKTNMPAIHSKTYAWSCSTSLQPVPESVTHFLVPLRQRNYPYILCKIRWILSRNMNRDNRKNQLLAFDLQSISFYHGLETWLALTKEILVVPGSSPPICDEYRLETRLSTTAINRELAVDLHPNCTENEHETWFATNDEFPVFTIDVQPTLLNVGTKNDSFQAKNLVYCISTYSLSAV